MTVRDTPDSFSNSWRQNKVRPLFYFLKGCFYFICTFFWDEKTLKKKVFIKAIKWNQNFFLSIFSSQLFMGSIKNKKKEKKKCRLKFLAWEPMVVIHSCRINETKKIKVGRRFVFLSHEITRVYLNVPTRSQRSSSYLSWVEIFFKF